MPEIEASEKRQGLHLAGFRSAAVESKENFLAGTPKMPAKCESQASNEGRKKTQPVPGLQNPTPWINAFKTWGSANFSPSSVNVPVVFSVHDFAFW